MAVQRLVGEPVHMVYTPVQTLLMPVMVEGLYQRGQAMSTTHKHTTALKFHSIRSPFEHLTRSQVAPATQIGA